MPSAEPATKRSCFPQKLLNEPSRTVKRRCRAARGPGSWLARGDGVLAQAGEDQQRKKGGKKVVFMTTNNKNEGFTSFSVQYFFSPSGKGFSSTGNAKPTHAERRISLPGPEPGGQRCRSIPAARGGFQQNQREPNLSNVKNQTNKPKKPQAPSSPSRSAPRSCGAQGEAPALALHGGDSSILQRWQAPSRNTGGGLTVW